MQNFGSDLAKQISLYLLFGKSNKSTYTHDEARKGKRQWILEIVWWLKKCMLQNVMWKTFMHWKITLSNSHSEELESPAQQFNSSTNYSFFSLENYILILVLASTFMLNSRLKSLSHFTSSTLKAHLKGKRYTIPNLQLFPPFVSKFWQIWYCMKLIFLEWQTWGWHWIVWALSCSGHVYSW